VQNDQEFLAALRSYVAATLNERDAHSAETKLMSALHRMIEDQVNKALASRGIQT
jgi:hypothetical protein